MQKQCTVLYRDFLSGNDSYIAYFGSHDKEEAFMKASQQLFRSHGCKFHIFDVETNEDDGTLSQPQGFGNE